MPQESAIAAGNHGEAVLDEIHRCISERRRLPGLGGDPVFAEEDLGDFAVACAVSASVDSLQHIAQTTPALRRQARVAWNGSAEQSSHEARDGVKAVGSIDIERDEGSERLVRYGVGQKKQIGGLAAAQCVADEDSTFGSLTLSDIGNAQETGFGANRGRRWR